MKRIQEPRFDVGLADFADRYDLVLCDVWGVVHNGVEHHRSAVDALRRFRAAGGTVVLVTNAPAPRAQVQRRLDRLAVPRDAYDAIATSGDVTIGLIVEAGCPALLNIGPAGEVAVYREAGRIGPREPTLVPVDEAAMAICIGLDETGDEPADYDGLLRALRARQLDMVCANPDLVVEMGDALVYCAGAIAERYEAIGGRVVHAGKPHAPIYEMAVALGRERGGNNSRERILAIGDAIHTDIRGARNQGIASILVTTGIHRARLHAGDRVSSIDKAALAQFLDEQDVMPTAAVPLLAWTA